MLGNKLNFKLIALSLIIIVVLATIGFCSAKPKMHKPLEFGIIEYLIKINPDGSTSTIKQITTTTVQEKK